MSQDPRFLNQVFDATTVASFFADYTQSLHSVLQQVSSQDLEQAIEVLNQARLRGLRVFVAGNGGSAAISEHLCCDWQKGMFHPLKKKLVVQSLVSNAPVLTAIANDIGYDQTFSYQLELADLKKEEVVVLISSSGNSPNIVHAAQFAKRCGATVIGMSGFSGGKLRQLADVSLYVPFENYGLVEDAHQSLMHIMAQFLDLKIRREL